MQKLIAISLPDYFETDKFLSSQDFKTVADTILKNGDTLVIMCTWPQELPVKAGLKRADVKTYPDNNRIYIFSQEDKNLSDIFFNGKHSVVLTEHSATRAALLKQVPQYNEDFFLNSKRSLGLCYYNYGLKQLQYSTSLQDNIVEVIKLYDSQMMAVILNSFARYFDLMPLSGTGDYLQGNIRHSLCTFLAVCRLLFGEYSDFGYLAASASKSGSYDKGQIWLLHPKDDKNIKPMASSVFHEVAFSSQEDLLHALQKTLKIAPVAAASASAFNRYPGTLLASAAASPAGPADEQQKSSDKIVAQCSRLKFTLANDI